MPVCDCITKNGTRCSRNAMKGSKFCYQHQNCKPSKMADVVKIPPKTKSPPKKKSPLQKKKSPLQKKKSPQKAKVVKSPKPSKFFKDLLAQAPPLPPVASPAPPVLPPRPATPVLPPRPAAPVPVPAPAPMPSPVPAPVPRRAGGVKQTRKAVAKTAIMEGKETIVDAAVLAKLPSPQPVKENPSTVSPAKKMMEPKPGQNPAQTRIFTLNATDYTLVSNNLPVIKTNDILKDKKDKVQTLFPLTLDLKNPDLLKDSKNGDIIILPSGLFTIKKASKSSGKDVYYPIVIDQIGMDKLREANEQYDHAINTCFNTSSMALPVAITNIQFSQSLVKEVLKHGVQFFAPLLAYLDSLGQLQTVTLLKFVDKFKFAKKQFYNMSFPVLRTSGFLSSGQYLGMQAIPNIEFEYEGKKISINYQVCFF